MGPEELAIITNPQFINTTFRAGENWYHNLVARAREAEELARHRNAYEAANAQFVVVNRQLLEGARRHNEEWRRHAESIVQQFNERVALDERLYTELQADYKAEVEDRRAKIRLLAEATSLCSEKDASISQLQTDLAGVRGSLGATQDALAHERQSLASVREESARTQSALQAVQGDRDRLQDGLKQAEGAVSALEASQREAALVTQAVEAAGMTVMYVTAQAMEAWAGQGKPSMLDNLMTSHFKAGGQPMTMREYLWFATLIKEMKSRSIPDRLIVERCPVDGIAESNGIEDFLARDVSISESKADTADGRDIYVGWLVVDGVCRPFGAESKRNCMRMMAGFIGEMAAKHAAHEKQYPELAELSPYWFSGVYTTPDIELLMSNKDIDADKIDVFFGQAIQVYLTDPNVKISAFTVPGRTIVVGGYSQTNLFAAIVDDGNAFSAMVSADQVGAQAWLAGHIADEVGPSLGKPGLSIEDARTLMKTDACPTPVVDVLPLTVSDGIEMRLKLANVGVAA